MSRVFQPVIPFHDDELTQGYFARIGYFQAGVDVGTFCRFFDLLRTDFKTGNNRCIEAIAAISGQSADRLGQNAIQALPDGNLMLKGEILGLPIVRRVTAQFCPHCLAADEEAEPALGRAAWRFRWTWLLKPVVACPVHNLALVSLPAKDPVAAFDLRKLSAQNHLDIAPIEDIDPLSPGSLQRYVISRIADNAPTHPWLDRQRISGVVKICETLGSLICDGPSAEIKSYTELERARVGSSGFDVCSRGPAAILEALSEVRHGSGCRSGRTGPQAVFGNLYRWVKQTGREIDARPFRDLVRQSIIENFAVGPGDVVLGQVVDQRRVHSVNSLANTTGLNRFRLYRVMRKTGMISEDVSGAALNQFVFSADQAERLIAQIKNATPLNQVHHILGCSVTHVENLVRGGFISSIVPMDEGDVGLTRGDFNIADLSEFLDDVCIGTNAVECEVDGFLNLSRAARGRSTTAQIIGWQVDGSLQRTRLMGGIKRLDNLRFCLAEIRDLIDQTRGPDMHRLKSVIRILGISNAACRRLISEQGGGPWLFPALEKASNGHREAICISTAELERFKDKYVTSALLGRELRSNFWAVQKVLHENNVQPVIDPDWLGAKVYLRADIDAHKSELLRILTKDVMTLTSSKFDVEIPYLRARSSKNGESGESDGSTQ